MIGCAEICRAACCRNIRWNRLNDKQLAAMLAKDGKVYSMGEPGIYKISGPCAHLTSDNCCSVYGTSLRPDGCTRVCKFMGDCCRNKRFYNPKDVISYLPEEATLNDVINQRTVNVIGAALKIFVASDILVFGHGRVIKLERVS